MSFYIWQDKADRPEHFVRQLDQAEQEKRDKRAETEMELWYRDPYEWSRRYSPSPFAYLKIGY